MPPSNARMTFRFEPPKPKPIPATSARPADRPAAGVATESSEAPETGRFESSDSNERDLLADPAAFRSDELDGSAPSSPKAELVTPGGTSPKSRSTRRSEAAASPIDVETGHTGYAAWESPYQDDIRALEEIIRTSDRTPLFAAGRPARPTQPSKETAGAQPSQPTQPKSASPFAKKDKRYVREMTILELPESEPAGERYGRPGESGFDDLDDGGDGRPNNGWYDSISTTEIVRDPGPSWGRVILSVAGAIGTGILFGYLALGLFTGDPLFPSKPGTESQLPAQASVRPDGTTGQSAAGKTEAGARPAAGTDSPVSAAVEIDSDRYYVLQYGVFQSADSMEIAAEELRSKGYSSATDASDGYRVYVAAAPTKDEAELLALRMPDAEVYIKPIDGDALTLQAGDARNGPAAEYIEASSAMIRELVRASSAGLQARVPETLSATELEAWRTAHKRWLEASAAAGKLDGAAAKEAKAVAKPLNDAAAAMEEFLRNPSAGPLWNIQSDAMEALFAEHRLRSLVRSAAT